MARWFDNLIDLAVPANGILGSLAILIGGIGGALGWWASKARAQVREERDEERIRARLSKVESDVADLRGELTAHSSRMASGFETVNDRIDEVERRLETVATRADIEDLRIAQARVDARLEGMVQNDRQLLELLQGQGLAISDLSKMLAVKGLSSGLD